MKGKIVDKIELYEKIVEGTNQDILKRHRLFPVFHDGDFIKKILSNPMHQNYLNDLHQTAEGYLGVEITVLPWHLFKEYDTSGNRTAYEKAYFEHRGRLMTFALMAWLYHKPEYILALEDTIWAICEEYTWSLPAHLYSKSLEPESQTTFQNGKMVQIGFNPETNIDLFAAETAFAFSEIIYMLEEYLSPLVVHRAKKEVFRRVLMSYLTYPGIHNWERMKNNWCAVCAGSIGIAGIYLMEDDAVLAQLIHRLSPTLERFLDSFEADGACLEGLSYFTYGVSFFVAFADLLKRRTAGGVDLLNSERFEQIACFQHKCYFPEGWTVSFSDANQKDHFRSGLTSYLMNRFNKVKMPPRKYKAGFLFDPCFRWCNGIRDLIWTVEQQPEKAKEVTYEVLAHAQWMLCKQYTGHCYGLAVKGGNNDEPHNHNDVGSFIFYKDGDCLLTDLGSGEYTKDYFGVGRYAILCNSSLGHSVPIIQGEGQKAGRQYSSKKPDYDGRGRMIMDISETYGNQYLKQLNRELTFIEGEGILLTDTFHISEGITHVIERLITLYEPMINDDSVVIQGEKTACSVRYNRKLMTPTVTRHNHKNHEGEDVIVFSIDFDIALTSEIVICRFEIR